MMSADSTQPSPSRKWPTRLRRLAYLAVAVWLTPFVYTRLTTEPPEYSDLYAYTAELYKPLPEDDVTDKLEAAFASLPPEPYAMDFSMALVGPWAPEQRILLKDIIHYLDLPETQRALAEIRKHAGGPARYPHVRSSSYSPGTFLNVAKYLCADMRYQFEEFQNPERVIANWIAVLKIFRSYKTAPFSFSYLISSHCEAMAASAIVNLAADPDFPLQALQEINKGLSAYSSFAVNDWTKIRRAERRLQEYGLTTQYSQSGWRYLATAHLYKPWGRQQGGRRSRIWNLFSPLFHDRDAVTERIDKQFELFLPADGLNYVEAKPLLGAADRFSNNFTVLDGPFEQGLSTMSQVYMLLARIVTLQNFTRTILAIEIFRKETGALPKDLSELVPDCVDEIPIDFFDGKPLRYLRTDEAPGYILYSVGEDCIDQGGNFEKVPKTYQPLDFHLNEPRRGVDEWEKDEEKNRPKDPWAGYSATSASNTITQPAGSRQ